jgi:hypothetical protein
MIDARRLCDACFHAAVAVSQAFIAVVAGVAVAFALWSWARALPFGFRFSRTRSAYWHIADNRLFLYYTADRALWFPNSG